MGRRCPTKKSSRKRPASPKTQDGGVGKVARCRSSPDAGCTPPTINSDPPTARCRQQRQQRRQSPQRKALGTRDSHVRSRGPDLQRQPVIPATRSRVSRLLLTPPPSSASCPATGRTNDGTAGPGPPRACAGAKTEDKIEDRPSTTGEGRKVLFDFDPFDEGADEPPIRWDEVQSYVDFRDNKEAHDYWQWDRSVEKWKHVDETTGDIMYCPSELD